MAPMNSVPPPSTGYWAWVKDELMTKADEKWVEAELRNLRRTFDDTKVTATDAKKSAEKPYVCMKEKEIEKLKTWQEQVTNWKIPVIVSIVVLIIGAVGQYFSLKDSVEDGNEARMEVQETLEKIQAQQVQTSETVEDLKYQQEYRNEKQMQELNQS